MTDPKQHIIDNLSNKITINLLTNKNREEKFLDPITIMIVSIIISGAIQVLIPIIKEKCKNRAENIKNGSAKPSLLMILRARLALRASEQKNGNNLSAYGITIKEAYTEIFNNVKAFDTETIHYVVYD